MLYAIVTKDVVNSAELRKTHSIEHMTRLTELKNLGKLVIAGPLAREQSIDTHIAGVDGSLIVAEFKSLNEAQQWIDEDPFSISGVYQSVRVNPFKKLLP